MCRRLVDAGVHVVPVLTDDATRFVGPSPSPRWRPSRSSTSLWRGRSDPAHPPRPDAPTSCSSRRPRPTSSARYAAGHRRRPAHGHPARHPGAGRRLPGHAHRDVGAPGGAGEPGHAARAAACASSPPEEGRLAGGDVGAGPPGRAGRRSSPPSLRSCSRRPARPGRPADVRRQRRRDPRADRPGARSSPTARRASRATRSPRPRPAGRRGGARHDAVAAGPARGSTRGRAVETAAEMEAALCSGARRTPTWSSWPPRWPTSGPKAPAEQKLTKDDGRARASSSSRPRTSWPSWRRRRRPGQVLVGFAAETDDALDRAAAQARGARASTSWWSTTCRRPASGFDHDTNAVTILGADGERRGGAARPTSRRWPTPSWIGWSTPASRSDTGLDGTRRKPA